MTRDKNQVILKGQVARNPVLSHAAYGKNFYRMYLDVVRLSGNTDRIPLIAAEEKLEPYRDYTGCQASVFGEYRSFNYKQDGKRHLALYVHVHDMWFGDSRDALSENHILLEGIVCKEPIWRRTPLQKEVTDLLVAVNCRPDKSEYIPCICWRRNARAAALLHVGERIMLKGRIQSRGYKKILPDGLPEEHVAYEVSVFHIGRHVEGN